MFDHMGFNISNFAKSRAFYAAALKPLGVAITAEGDGWIMLKKAGKSLWVGAFGKVATPIHIAFEAEDRPKVRAFYEAAMAAGGRDNGPPGPRAHYHADYYAAFVLDPDGNNIEAVCHGPA